MNGRQARQRYTWRGQESQKQVLRDLVRNFLRTLAACWGHEFQLPRVEYNPDDPTVTAIEDVEWELIDSLDSLVIHVLAVTVPELKRLLDRLSLHGDGCPEPRPWQIVGAAGGPPNPLSPAAPSHEDYDAVRNDRALAARLAAYDPSDDEPPAAGAAASTDPVVIDPIGEGAAVGAPVQAPDQEAPDQTTAASRRVFGTGIGFGARGGRHFSPAARARLGTERY